MGIKTEFNKAFIIPNQETKAEICNLDPRSNEIIKPLIRGRDIAQYVSDSPPIWIINAYSSYINSKGEEIERINIEDYPAVREYMDAYYRELKLRKNQGDTCYNLRKQKIMEFSEEEKVIFPDNTSRLTLSFDVGGNLLLNTAYFMYYKGYHKFLLAMFNSQLMGFYHRLIANVLGKKGYRHFLIYINELPIVKLPESELGPYNTLVDEIIRKKKLGEPITNEQKEIDQLVYKLYDLTPKEIKHVEEYMQD